MLAAGHIDLVIETGLKPYDIVALIPIIEGAGGIVTTWDGGSAAEGGRIVAAGDRRLHAAAARAPAAAESTCGSATGWRPASRARPTTPRRCPG